MTKFVNLYDLTELEKKPTLSSRYVAYKSGHDPKIKYRADEIEGICKMIDSFKMKYSDADSFLYGYKIANPENEFDLLKITKRHCINIELKSHSPSLDEAKEQLVKHRYFLKMTGKSLILCTYYFDHDDLYILKGNNLIKYEKGDPALFDALN